jgi:hypothetical protein
MSVSELRYFSAVMDDEEKGGREGGKESAVERFAVMPQSRIPNILKLRAHTWPSLLVLPYNVLHVGRGIKTYYSVFPVLPF